MREVVPSTVVAAAAAREELGPYLIYDRIGMGGMATVDRALERGIEGVDRLVALKRLLPHLTFDEVTVRAFVREARLGTLLQHANIAQTYSLGRVGTVYFIAMELVDGCNLFRVLKHARAVGPPPIAVTTAIIRQLCDALEYAHDRRDIDGRPLGLVHRDLSPSNLLLTRSGHLKIIDFGIAQSVHRHTRTLRIEGKLPYMSPEAITGDPMDHRSDLFSVGIVFHELLTARPLFHHAADPSLDRPTIKPPTKVRGDIPPVLDLIVMRALATDPDKRWPSAAAFRAALLAASPVCAAPNEVAAWCKPVLDADASGPIELPVEEAEAPTTGSAVVLDDVVDYAEFQIGSGTSPGVAPPDVSKWRHVSTIETVIPPPARTSSPQAVVPPSGPPVVIRSGQQPVVSRTMTPPSPSGPLSRAIPVSQPPIDTQRTDIPPRRTTEPMPTVASGPETGRVTGAPMPAVLPRPRLEMRIGLFLGIGAIAIGLVIAIAISSRSTDPRGETAPPIAAESIASGAGTAIVTDPVKPSVTTGAVTIEVSPTDATITVGARPPHRGSPWTLRLDAGSYPVEIHAPDHSSWQTTLVVKPGETQRVHATLASTRPVPLATATLAIDSVPSRLEVTLDGVVLANRTPVRMGVTPGKHKIVVRNAGADMWSTDFVALDNHNHRFMASAPSRPAAVTTKPAPEATTPSPSEPAAPAPQPEPTPAPAEPPPLR